MINVIARAGNGAPFLKAVATGIKPVTAAIPEKGD